MCQIKSAANIRNVSALSYNVKYSIVQLTGLINAPTQVFTKGTGVLQCFVAAARDSNVRNSQDTARTARRVGKCAGHFYTNNDRARLSRLYISRSYLTSHCCRDKGFAPSAPPHNTCAILYRRDITYRDTDMLLII